jgi:hypothetical protein
MSVETSGVVGLVINNEKQDALSTAFNKFGEADNTTIEQASIIRNILGPNPSWEVYDGYRRPALANYVEKRKVSLDAAEKKWTRVLKLLDSIELGIQVPKAPPTKTAEAERKRAARATKDNALEKQIKELREKAKLEAKTAGEKRDHDRDTIKVMLERYHSMKNAEGDAVLALMVARLNALMEELKEEAENDTTRPKSAVVIFDKNGNSNK